jgi:alkaline phosphatase D
MKFTIPYCFAALAVLMLIHPDLCQAQGWGGQTPPKLTLYRDLRLAFGSCNEGTPAPIFKAIQAKRPSLFMFLGDNIYQTEREMGHYVAIKEHYRRLFAVPDMQLFFNSVPTFAVWDDHDFGPNDTDNNFPGKGASLRAFREQWRNPSAPKGLEDSITFELDLGEILILATDSRTYRINPNRAGATLFGKKQRDWLKSRLLNNSARVVVVASGTQLLSTATEKESLAQYPAEYDWLQLLMRLSPAQIVIISGDQHYGEAMNVDLGSKTVWEISSSPLHQIIQRKTLANQHRVGPTIMEQNFGMLTFKSRRDKVQIQAELFGEDGKSRISYEF